VEVTKWDGMTNLVVIADNFRISPRRLLITYSFPLVAVGLGLQLIAIDSVVRAVFAVAGRLVSPGCDQLVCPEPNIISVPDIPTGIGGGQDFRFFVHKSFAI